MSFYQHLIRIQTSSNLFGYLDHANTTLADLYNFMLQVHSNIEKELCKPDKKFTTFDCHLCLYVRGQSTVIRRWTTND
jgi:hypothetical protein